jgi:glutamate formiminotransferase
VLECVINVSEGRDLVVVEAVARAAGAALLDVHRDAHHHRSVLTLAGPDVEAAARAVATEGVARIDLRGHHGAHPRLGAVDVVPFVPLGDDDAAAARDAFAAWAAHDLGLPCFLYGPERPLPEVRRRAFVDLAPDTGPSTPHATAGASAVGARPVLVAYNLWLAEADMAEARAVARSVRSAHVRALAFDLGGTAQVSCNLVAPSVVGPAAVYDSVARTTAVARAELVGLLPAVLLDAVPRHRWAELDLDPSRTIEARLLEAGLDGGRFRRLG